ncbi:HOTHEAD-like protein [Tanacetum coccineum]
MGMRSCSYERERIFLFTGIFNFKIPIEINSMYLSYLYLENVTSEVGEYKLWQDQYPFIRKASSFSSSSKSTRSNGEKKEYDYIVVGGGTAGCPLAATLSQNYSVLLLERGGVPFTNRNVSLLSNFHLTLADTSDESASQYFVSTDGVFNARARVLGGGSAINAGFYTRASTSYVKRAGWDAKLVNESYPWVEKQIVHTQPRRSTIGKSAVRDSREKPRAVGVIFKDEDGTQHKAVISRRRMSEIIVTCGAIGSPQLLLLSGIGPRADLEKMNISVVHDNKFVGKNMSDNPLNTVFVPFNRPVKQSLIETVGITKMGVYIEASSGFSQSSDSIHCHHGLASAEIGQLSTIPPKRRTQEAIEAFKRNKKDLPHEAFHGGFILEKLAHPKSKGQLILNNTNVDDNPIITFNYFSHPKDVQQCVRGMRVVEKLVKSGPFLNFTKHDEATFEKLLNMSVTANINMIPRHTNDTKSLKQFCRDTVISIWHYHGGCHVGQVVNKDYIVSGVHRLRVIDGSTFNLSPGTNPQATVMMLGRYMGVKILRDRLGTSASSRESYCGLVIGIENEAQRDLKGLVIDAVAHDGRSVPPLHD